MCGIAGYVGNGDKKTLVAMLQSISHRGPDDNGIFIDGEIGLGHNRLSIIDLSSRGKQPMFDSEKTVCIVFNGEIYNFQDLRKQLESKYSFKSKTDTEVLLYAYKEWGVRCLEKLNGMFSFVIYDKKKQLLFGARDRLGEKPLKYYLDRNIFAFASEIKGLLPILKSTPEIDPVAIDHYLTFQYVPVSHTGFKNIFKLPRAHYFIFKNGKLQIKQYWDISFTEKLSLSEEDWEEMLLQKIKESVKTRLIADVPIGVFLSGGVDSSAVVALMAQNSRLPVKTFSIGFEDPNFNELKYANIVAKHYQTDHQTFKVTYRMMSDIFVRLADYYDEPFADNSAIPMLLLSQLTRKHVRVALSGDGGDENFGGYTRYNVVAFSQFYKRVPKIARSLLTTGARITDLVANTKLTHRAYTYATTFDLPFYERNVYYNCFFDNKTKNHLYTREFRELIDNSDSFQIFKSLYKPQISDLDNALNFDFSYYLPEDLLFKTDIASMAFSLEVRSPLLNHELVELTSRMPDWLKVKFFNKKYILKKLLVKNNILPKEVVYRSKKGFVAPIEKWLKGDLKNFVIDQVTSSKLLSKNIFDRERLRQYLQDYFQDKHTDSNNIFSLLSLSSWINKYC